MTHGHLTSANILLAIDGQVKVTDFRLAQAARPPAAVSEPATDLRGLGRCLAVMLTGREPAAGEPIGLSPEVPTELAAIVARTAGGPEGASRSAADLGHDLDRFLASVHPGAAPTAAPDVAPGYDQPAMAAAACSPAAQLMPMATPGAPVLSDISAVNRGGPR